MLQFFAFTDFFTINTISNFFKIFNISTNTRKLIYNSKIFETLGHKYLRLTVMINIGQVKCRSCLFFHKIINKEIFCKSQIINSSVFTTQDIKKYKIKITVKNISFLSLRS